MPLYFLFYDMLLYIFYFIFVEITSNPQASKDHRHWVRDKW
jgi:hypothetical protein